jgi:hypothetical protein
MKFYSNTSTVKSTSNVPGAALNKSTPALVFEYMEKAKISPDTVLEYKLTTVESKGLLALIFGRAGEKKTTIDFKTLENGTKTEYKMIVKDAKPSV